MWLTEFRQKVYKELQIHILLFEVIFVDTFGGDFHKIVLKVKSQQKSYHNSHYYYWLSIIVIYKNSIESINNYIVLISFNNKIDFIFKKVNLISMHISITFLLHWIPDHSPRITKKWNWSLIKNNYLEIRNRYNYY